MRVRLHNTLSWMLVRVYPRGRIARYCERHVGPTLWERDTEWVN
jgi:hypothetical protein